MAYINTYNFNNEIVTLDNQYLKSDVQIGLFSLKAKIATIYFFIFSVTVVLRNCFICKETYRGKKPN